MSAATLANPLLRRPERLATLAELRARVPGLPGVAISIKQPWAHFIVCGKMDVENRSWRTNFRGPILIHASGQADAIYLEDEEFIARAIGEPYPDELSEDHAPCGGIVGMAEIVDCVSASDSPWFTGEHGFVLRHARRLPFVPMHGKLGIWRVE